MNDINPRVDLVFKKIFGSPKNDDLLISLINSIVSDEDQVESIEVLNPYNEREFVNDKLSILDIKAKDKTGQFYNIEIQITDENDYDKRALYYWAKLYSGQLEKGMKYKELRKTIGIHLLNFTSILEAKNYHSCFKLKEVNQDFVYFKDIELHTIELSKFLQNSDKDGVEQIQTALDLWVAFLTRNDLLSNENLPPDFDAPEIKKAINVLEHMSLNRSERDTYDNRLKWLMIEESALDKAREDGVEEGIEIGREEERKQIARVMKVQGMPIDDIAKFTNLPKSLLENL